MCGREKSLISCTGSKNKNKNKLKLTKVSLPFWVWSQNKIPVGSLKMGAKHRSWRTKSYDIYEFLTPRMMYIKCRESACTPPSFVGSPSKGFIFSTWRPEKVWAQMLPIVYKQKNSDKSILKVVMQIYYLMFYFLLGGLWINLL